MKKSNEKRVKIFSYILLVVFFLNIVGLVLSLSTNLFSERIEFKYSVVIFFIVINIIIILVLYYIKYVRIEINEGIIIVRYCHPLLLEDRLPEFEIPVHRLESFKIIDNILYLFIKIKEKEIIYRFPKKFSIIGLDRKSIRVLKIFLQYVIDNKSKYY